MTVDQRTAAPSKRRRVLVIGGVIAALIGVVVLVWFQPQKLFLDQTVDEAAPSAAVGPGAQRAAEREPKADAREGTFRSLAHATSGRAVVRVLADGSSVLRLEDFETENGPDLRVYLSAGDESSYGKDFVDLGALKGNIGDQNYAIPAGTDVVKYDTAVIWCRRFTVGFGAAKLA